MGPQSIEDGEICNAGCARVTAPQIITKPKKAKQRERIVNPCNILNCRIILSQFCSLCIS